jgi:16S rRNA processing protein RimM
VTTYGSRSSSSTTDVEGPRRLEVGRVDKAHGLGGELVITLTTNRLERIESGSVLFVDGVARVVDRSRPHLRRFIVRLEGVADKEAADALRGAILEADALADPEAVWVHELVGAHVRDVDGVEVGVVEAVEANPASDLLVLDTGALVPLTFVIEHVDHPEHIALVIDPPPGLLEL